MENIMNAAYCEKQIAALNIELTETIKAYNTSSAMGANMGLLKPIEDRAGQIAAQMTSYSLDATYDIIEHSDDPAMTLVDHMVYTTYTAKASFNKKLGRMMITSGKRDAVIDLLDLNQHMVCTLGVNQEWVDLLVKLRMIGIIRVAVSENIGWIRLKNPNGGGKINFAALREINESEDYHNLLHKIEINNGSIPSMVKIMKQIGESFLGKKVAIRNGWDRQLLDWSTSKGQGIDTTKFASERDFNHYMLLFLHRAVHATAASAGYGIQADMGHHKSQIEGTAYPTAVFIPKTEKKEKKG